MDDLEREINENINRQNKQGIADFEGYSPTEMEFIIYYIFEKNCPVQLLTLSDSDYKFIPILNQLKYLARLIEIQGELKLTSRGYLPTKIVSDIYSQGFIKDEFIESGISKLYKETDSNTINLTRILLELSGIVKKRNKKLSLTKNGKKLIDDNERLLYTVFKTFGTKFNWAYYDGYGQNNTGQLGFGFSLVILSKYGDRKRLDNFYSKKYLKAFPALLNEFSTPRFGTIEEQASRCYSIRTFDRFLDYLGLIKIETDGSLFGKKRVMKTELFDKLIKCSPHNSKA